MAQKSRCIQNRGKTVLLQPKKEYFRLSIRGLVARERMSLGVKRWRCVSAWIPACQWQKPFVLCQGVSV